jgi:hypothetical protein
MDYDYLEVSADLNSARALHFEWHARVSTSMTRILPALERRVDEFYVTEMESLERSVTRHASSASSVGSVMALTRRDVLFQLLVTVGCLIIYNKFFRK